MWKILKNITIGVVSVTAIIGMYYGVSSNYLPNTVAETALSKELDKFQKGLTYSEFVKMSEDRKKSLIKKMPYTTINLLLDAEAKINTFSNEKIDEIRDTLNFPDELTFKQSTPIQGIKGKDAQGIVRIIETTHKSFLRFEDFSLINGPDLYVYLTKDGYISTGIEIGKLKANNGEQNYDITGIDIKAFNVVIIYSKTFDIYFALAKIPK